MTTIIEYIIWTPFIILATTIVYIYIITLSRDYNNDIM